jgi:hypothetical protein
MKNPPKRIGIFLGDAGDAFPGASNLIDIFGYMIYGLQIVRGPCVVKTIYFFAGRPLILGMRSKSIKLIIREFLNSKFLSCQRNNVELNCFFNS